eukprot:315180-Pyramimonas_sp.AAC.1
MVGQGQSLGEEEEEDEETNHKKKQRISRKLCDSDSDDGEEDEEEGEQSRARGGSKAFKEPPETRGLLISFQLSISISTASWTEGRTPSVQTRQKSKLGVSRCFGLRPIDAVGVTAQMTERQRQMEKDQLEREQQRLMRGTDQSHFSF